VTYLLNILPRNSSRRDLAFRRCRLPNICPKGKMLFAVFTLVRGRHYLSGYPVVAIEQGHLEKVSPVVTPLNLLGKQNEIKLEMVGILAIAVSNENATTETLR
jgi:hypothetical protein